MTQTQQQTQKPQTMTDLQVVCETVKKMGPQFKEALPPHITVERFVRVAVTAIQTAPELLTQCSRPSLWVAFIKAAQDGLLPDGSEGAVIPYKGMAKWSPMIKGICKKARQSGEIKTLDAVVVHEKDQFAAWTDEEGPHFKHVPAFKDRGADLLTYAYAITKDGFYMEIVTEPEMADIEAASPGQNTPWKGKFRGEMKRKSALRRLAKHRLPSSSDLDDLVRRDDDMFQTDPEPEPPKDGEKKPSRLHDAMGISDAEVVPEPAPSANPSGNGTAVKPAEPPVKKPDAAAPAPAPAESPAPAEPPAGDAYEGPSEADLRLSMDNAKDHAALNAIFKPLGPDVQGKVYAYYMTRFNEIKKGAKS